MAKILVIQKRSINRCTVRQKNTVKALGLGKVDSCVEVEDTPQVLGMINKVKHLVFIENK
jgi:large subunit ribosomal protein L30